MLLWGYFEVERGILLCLKHVVYSFTKYFLRKSYIKREKRVVETKEICVVARKSPSVWYCQIERSGHNPNFKKQKTSWVEQAEIQQSRDSRMFSKGNGGLQDFSQEWYVYKTYLYYKSIS